MARESRLFETFPEVGSAAFVIWASGLRHRTGKLLPTAIGRAAIEPMA